MSYYFQCDHCNSTTDVDSFDVISAKYELECKDCGEPLCPDCAYSTEGNSRCKDCHTDWLLDMEDENNRSSSEDV
jgi:hypothetical protein